MCGIYRPFQFESKDSWVDFYEVKMYALEAHEDTRAFLIYSIIF